MALGGKELIKRSTMLYTSYVYVTLNGGGGGGLEHCSACFMRNLSDTNSVHVTFDHCCDLHLATGQV